MNCRNQATIDANPIPEPGVKLNGNEQTLDGSFANAVSTPPPNNEKGSTCDSDFGEYELIGEIARGGMGVVFKARHKKLNRIVAIKMIRDGRLSSPQDIQRFHIEANAAAQLDHPGIVPIYEIGEHDGRPFFAMKFIEGGSLAQHIERFRSDQTKLVKFIVKIADAVHHAHQRGILHRDIKPANIVLDEAGEPLLTDLGLAKSIAGESELTQTGALVGTPSYMPPEQAHSGSLVTTAADIYSIGAILYEMLCGEPPHKAETVLETILKVRSEPVQPPRSLNKSVDRDLELICMKCLERDPQSRYSSAAGLSSDLQNWLNGEPLSVKPPTVFRSIVSLLRRNQGLVYPILVVFAGIIFSFPLVLSLLKIGAGAELYADSPEDPIPAIYKWTSFPTWISASSLIVMLLMWPTLGLIVVLVTRPKNIKQAMLNGTLVGAVCGLLFYVSIGWYPISRATIITAGSDIKSLTEGFWSGDGSDKRELDDALFRKYPLLKGMPAEARARYLENRIASDSIVSGSIVMLSMLGFGSLVAISIAGGSLIAKLLRDRNQAWWIFVPRYLASWLVAWSMVFVILTAFSVRINGSFFFLQLPLWAQACVLGLPAMMLFLLLRRWRKPERKTGAGGS